ncbi:MAG TPA: uracil-DNA glycosylase family protein [bacterium]|nr:uracil-DNA glycosylase family protein [bacterium]
MLYYDQRIVPVHGDANATVFLINEAPGPCEAYEGIPLVGTQGGNLYRALRKAGIGWANQFDNFAWPSKTMKDYKSPDKMQNRFELREKFLALRAKYIACSNAFPRWPRPDKDSNDWVAPECKEVLRKSNIARLRKEILPNHRVILVCGAHAWLACFGESLSRPARKERRRFNKEELDKINKRFSSKFSDGWYMGHTRRWSLNADSTPRVLKKVARIAW